MGFMDSLADYGHKRADNIRNVVGGQASNNLRLLFLFAVVVQIVDVFLLNFNRAGGFYIAVSLYSLITIWAFFALKGENHFVDLKKLIPFILISAVYIGMPFLTRYVPNTSIGGGVPLIGWVSFAIAILPAWPIYIGMKAKMPFVKHYVNFWMIILVIALIFGVSMNLKPGRLAAAGGNLQLSQAGMAANYIFENIGNGVKGFWKALNPKRFIDNALDASGLNYYTGMIDNNEKEPVGLYIDNLRLIDDYIYEGSSAIIWADIRGKSFTEPIIFNPNCYIKGEPSGKADPVQINILGEEHETISCEFEGLKAGSYSAEIGGSFNFETWAYVTYTFVDLDTSRAMSIQGKDINRELNIPRLPEAVYTNGPIMLGMAATVDQPVPVDTLKNSRQPVLGVTIDTLWTDTGSRNDKDQKLKVSEFEIKVPKEDFELIKCDRKFTKSSDDKEPSYDSYKFSEMDLKDLRQSFKSVTCRLKINNPAKLLGGSQKVQRTFIAKAKYIFPISKRISFYVKK